jgi:hypothetical protein
MALTKLPKDGLATGSVSTSQIEDGTIQNQEFEDNTLTSAKLADSTIANAKLSNSTITLNGTSLALGASGTFFDGKLVEWQSVVTTNTTMVAGRGYFVNTTGGAVTMTLPSSATIGDTISIKDYTGNFGSNNVTIGRNGHNIQGASNDSILETNRASVTLVYADATKGWLFTDEHNVGDLELNPYVTATGGTITNTGDFRIHTFNSSSNFVVSDAGAGNPYSGKVSYLVVAGGGGGGGAQHGGNQRSGGGGAGGFREGRVSTPDFTASPLVAPAGLTVTAQTYPITVGGGGAGSYNGRSNGSNSIFSTITSAGGGYGGEVRIGSPADDPTTGGSGGGASASSGNCRAGASGNTPPVSPPQGNAGGSSTGYNAEGGGGGGAIEAGNTDGQAAGGDGASSEISGSAVTRAGGGAGNYVTSPSDGGGGVSPSGPSSVAVGTNGSTNTGSGGGAGRGSPSNPTGGGSGGSGVVIIRYKYQN